MTEEEKQAKKTANETARLLKVRGWCFWKCSELDGDIITIIHDDFDPDEKEEKQIMNSLGLALGEGSITDIKDNDWIAPVYTEKELKILAESDNIRFLHQAKKISGGTLMPQEDAK